VDARAQILFCSRCVSSQELPPDLFFLLSSSLPPPQRFSVLLCAQHTAPGERSVQQWSRCRPLLLIWFPRQDFVLPPGSQLLRFGFWFAQPGRSRLFRIFLLLILLVGSSTGGAVCWWDLEFPAEIWTCTCSGSCSLTRQQRVCFSVMMYLKILICSFFSAVSSVLAVLPIGGDMRLVCA
jgi:hypothetical protein